MFITKLLNLGIDPSTKAEDKLIKLLNYICVTWYFLIVFFIVSDYFIGRQMFFLVVLGHLIQFFILMIVQYNQYKKRYETARILFITSSTIQFFIFCNFLVTGNLIEFFYIITPLFSLLFLKKKIYHYFFLGIAIFCFSVVPELFNIYPKARTESVTTMPLLFITIFLLFSYFKNANTKNELLLEQERQKIEDDKVKIEQQALELKELNEFQSHFFVNVTHELRTPLTLIKGNILGAKKLNSISHIQQKLDKVLIQSNKIENLINNIIDVTKAEASTLNLNIELHPINQIIQKQYLSFKNLFDDKEINFTFSLLEKDINVEIDKLYFERVIGNILVNAAKYVPNGGQVAIYLTHTNKQICITIEDNGIGIALGEEVKIFNRFYQIKNDINKASGSGIGLAFCKEVIQLIKGNIIAFQNNHGGATFKITLPSVHSDIISQKPKSNMIIDTDKLTVLLVDDNIEIREYISSILTNYNIIEANNGIEALKILKHQPVDALITDYMMPIMDGYELIKEVKKQKYTFPILVITARADTKSRLDILALGIDDYLTKPFVEEELVYRLRNSLSNAKNRTAFQEKELRAFNNEDDTVAENDLIIKSRFIIEENIENPLFGVPNLVETLAISERTLYRKIKMNAGLTPNQFIREIKLCYVRNLIEQNQSISLTELTKKVGLKNAGHLQKIYKERFGTTICS